MRQPLLAVLAVCLMADVAHAAKAKWTVMVYMNGDNNLEENIVADYEEMARVGSSADVRIVTQLDRLAVRRQPLTEPEWADTYRFVVEVGKPPIPANAAASLGEVNMVDGVALGEFVRWAIDENEADHYALIISSHGDGFRKFDPLEVPTAPDPPQFLPSGSFDAPERSISTDDTTGGKDRLFISEITDNLRKVLAGRMLDVLGFDACLMGTVEVAYAFSGMARVIVASEELEPGSGWDYERWLQPLVAAPGLNGRDVATKIQQAYKAAQLKRQDESRTLSAVDLAKLKDATDAMRAVTAALSADVNRHRAAVEAARRECAYFAPTGCKGRPCFFNIDLGHFMSLLAAKTPDAGMKAKAQAVVSALRGAFVIQPYAGSLRSGADFGASGLAIYFPESAKHMRNDALIGGAYSPKNDHFPIEFVKSNVGWAQFLHKFYGIPE